MRMSWSSFIWCIALHKILINSWQKRQINWRWDFLEIFTFHDFAWKNNENIWKTLISINNFAQPKFKLLIWRIHEKFVLMSVMTLSRFILIKSVSVGKNTFLFDYKKRVRDDEKNKLRSELSWYQGKTKPKFTKKAFYNFFLLSSASMRWWIYKSNNRTSW